MGFKEALAQARPVLLEPIMHLEVTVPDESMGDVIRDLNSAARVIKELREARGVTAHQHE